MNDPARLRKAARTARVWRQGIFLHTDLRDDTDANCGEVALTISGRPLDTYNNCAKATVCGMLARDLGLTVLREHFGGVIVERAGIASLGFKQGGMYSLKTGEPW